MSDGIFDPKIPLEKVIEPTKQVISEVVTDVVSDIVSKNEIPSFKPSTSMVIHKTNPVVLPETSSVVLPETSSVVLPETSSWDTIQVYIQEHPWIIALLLISLGCIVIYNLKTNESNESKDKIKPRD